MASRARQRANAIAAAEGACPRCGTPRDADQRYCLECGLPLPAVTGTLPSLRRRWIQSFGWYPGDWVWISVLTLVVAIAGAAASIAVTQSNAKDAGHVFVATPGVSVNQPTTVPAHTATLPVAPEPTTTRPGRTTNPVIVPTTAPAVTPTAPVTQPTNGRLTWPASQNGWTIVLVSYPKTNGRPSALQTAAKAATAGVRQVGVLDSSRYASLQPGYYVVFAGIFPAKADADAALGTVHQAGFPGAYSRQIAR
jgi:hypothetical protein